MANSLTSLVSGGSRGLGLAIVERLLARGDRVATFSRSGSAALDELASGHPGRLHAETLDGGDSAAVIAFVGRVARAFGGIDHCIANAAVAHEGVLATMRDDEIDQMLSVNVKAAIVMQKTGLAYAKALARLRKADDSVLQATGEDIEPRLRQLLQRAEPAPKS